jgi:hypothetical protein
MRTAHVGSVSDHRAENENHQVPRVPLPDIGVTFIRETCAASCGDITPRSGFSTACFSSFSPRAWSVSSLLSWLLRLVLPTCVGMVRMCDMCEACEQGSPHVRGDGPFLAASCTSVSKFSPRAWGWSDSSAELRELHGVLPTCVGMVRRELSDFHGRHGSPHVRGDGPVTSNNVYRAPAFSPRAWGWSAPGVLPVSPHADHYREAA